MSDYSSSPRDSRPRPHRGVLILVLGIVGLVACQLLGPVAWVLGKGDLDLIRRGEMDEEGRGLTQAGMICGIIATGLLVLSVLIGIIMLAMFAVASPQAY